MRIIFMGTPLFASNSLNSLISSEHEVVTVFTQAPKKQGRGMNLLKSPIHEIALQNNIPTYTPKTLKTEEISEQIDNIDADIIVVVAYGFIIPEKILASKKLGAINIHPSELPKYRGAAPLQHTILNNEKESAVCIMQMDSGMDTGDILLQEKFTLKDDTNINNLHDYTSQLGAKLLIEFLDNNDKYKPIKQTTHNVSYAPKILKEHKKIQWSENADIIERKLRALNSLFFFHNGLRINLISAKIVNMLTEEIIEKKAEINQINNIQIGQLINQNGYVMCGNETVLKIEKVQPAGKQIMELKDFLNGIKNQTQEIIFE